MGHLGRHGVGDTGRLEWRSATAIGNVLVHRLNNETSNAERPTVQNGGALDCSICLLPLKTPFFVCDAGHTACSPWCCANGRCNACGAALSRCRAMERVVESISISCPFGLPATTCTRTVGCARTRRERAAPFTPAASLAPWTPSWTTSLRRTGGHTPPRTRPRAVSTYASATAPTSSLPSVAPTCTCSCCTWHRSRCAMQSLHSCYMGPTLSNASSSSHSPRPAIGRKARSKYRAPMMCGPLPTTLSSSSCPNKDAKMVSFQTTMPPSMSQPALPSTRWI